MNFDIVKMHKEQKEINRLKNKYSEISGFSTLKDIFPKLELGKDIQEKIIAYKVDNNKIIFYEENDISGILETDVIKIKYFSTYSYAVGLIIKKIIEENERLYRAFLSEYDTIAIGNNHKKTDRELVICNYLDEKEIKYSTLKRTLLKQLLRSYTTLDLEVEKELIRMLEIKPSQDKIDYVYIMYLLNINMQKSESLFLQFCSHGMYDDLRELLKNKDDLKKYAEIYKEYHVFDMLNQLIKETISLVPVLDYNIIFSALDFTRKNFEKTDMVLIDNRLNKSGNNKKRIDKKQILELVNEYFKYIDASGDLSKFFINILNNKEIIMWYPEEREKIINVLLKKGFKNDDIDSALYFRKEVDNEGKIINLINIPLTGTMSDVVSLIHEVIHYYSYSFEFDRKKSELDVNVLSEIIPIYFEVRASEWLEAKGYSQDEVLKTINFRIYNDFLNNSFSGVETILNLVQKQKEKGKITIENIMTDEEAIRIEMFNNIDFILSNFNDINMNKFPKVDISKVKIKQACKYVDYIYVCLKSFLRLKKQTTIISYCLGTYIANFGSNSDMDQKMLFVAKNMNDGDYNLRDQLDYLLNGTSLQNACKIHNNSSDHYLKKK